MRGQRRFSGAEHPTNTLCHRHLDGARPSSRVWCSHVGAPADGHEDGTRCQRRTTLGLKHSGALVQLNGDIFLFYNKSLGDLNVEKLALIMASATPATHAPSGSSSLTEDMGVWGLRPLC